MIQIKTFPIDKYAEASKFLKENGSRLPKDAIKFVGTVDPKIVIMYNDFEIGSDEDAKEGWTMELAGLNQQLKQYEQQLAEHTALSKMFDKNDKQEAKNIATHEEMVTTTTNMIRIQKSKIATVHSLIEKL